MQPDRSRILAEALRVDPSGVRWHFIADFYDVPISGLACFRDRVYRFCCFPEDIPEQHVYVLHELTSEELDEQLRIKDKFEALVGTLWSFDRDGKPLPYLLHPKELSRRFYDEEKIGCRADPRDRPVVAWFDLVHSDRAGG